MLRATALQEDWRDTSLFCVAVGFGQCPEVVHCAVSANGIARDMTPLKLDAQN